MDFTESADSDSVKSYVYDRSSNLYTDIGPYRVSMSLDTNEVRIYAENDGPFRLLFPIRVQETPSEWHTVYLYEWATNNIQKATDEFERAT